MVTVAERLQFLLECRDMKQKELADRAGISKQSLYQYLHCKCEPRASTIARMAEVLNTSADFIVGLTNDPTPRHCDPDAELYFGTQAALFSRLQRLSPDNLIRLEERLTFLLEQQV